MPLTESIEQGTVDCRRYPPNSAIRKSLHYSRNYCKDARRFRETGKFQDRIRSGRPKSIPDQHTKFFSKAMAENNELTASDLLERLKEKFGGEVLYSERTQTKSRQDLGWTFATAKY
jgi:transposase